MDDSNVRVFELISKRYHQIKIPVEIDKFLVLQDANGHRLSRVDSNEPLREFFARQGIAVPDLSTVIDENSTLRLKMDYKALIEKTPDEIFSFFLDHYQSLFHMQDVALDSDYYTGFNRHGLMHLRSVAINATKIVRSIVSLQEKTMYENEAIIGSFLHDIGNVISRKYHGFYGVYLLFQIFNNIDFNTIVFESFMNVVEVVLFHEVEYGSQLSDISMLHPPALSVIVADKTDVSYDRVSPKSNHPKAIQDAHVLINLLVAGSTTQRITGVDGYFRWTVNFRSKFDNPQIDIFSSLLKASGRIKYPHDWQRLYEESNIEYLFAFNSTFLKIYLSRLYFVMRAVFALYPSVNYFEFIIEDRERGISLKRIFSSEDFHSKVFQLGKHFFKSDWINTYLYQALIKKTQ